MIGVLAMTATMVACRGVGQTQNVADSLRVESHGRMEIARAAHAATGLPDGRVLITGGCTRSGCAGITASAELYDPATASFAEVSSMRVPRVSHAANVLADSSVLVTGGWTEQGVTDRAELYDPLSQRFRDAMPMLHARAGHRAVTLEDDRVLVLGGEIRTGASLASAEFFDATTGSFTSAGAMLQPRTGHSAVLLADGRVLIAGGKQTRGQVTVTAEIFDPTTGKFEATGSMMVPRQKHESVLLDDGRVLVVGGSDADDNRYSSTEIYDSRQHSFEPGPALRWPRHKIAGSVLLTEAGDVIVAGGAAHVEVLRVRDGTNFSQVAGEMDDRREFTTAVPLPNGSILIVGGYDDRIRPSSSVWIVKP